jgi:hypothetical protein
MVRAIIFMVSLWNIMLLGVPPRESGLYGKGCDELQHKVNFQSSAVAAHRLGWRSSERSVGAGRLDRKNTKQDQSTESQ